jgi:hypothetical protein
VKAFLLYKKGKNLVPLCWAGFTATGPEAQKFLRRFFQEAAAFLPGWTHGAAFVPLRLSLSAGFQFRMDWIWLGKNEAAKSMAG